MAASTGKAAFGSTLSYNSTPIGELKTITGPSISMDPIEITNHDSDDAFREYVAGLSDGGEISCTGNTTNTTLSAGILAQQTAQAIVITIPCGGGTGTWTCSGFITKFETSAPFDGVSEFSASFKLTGKPTFGVS